MTMFGGAAIDGVPCASSCGHVTRGGRTDAAPGNVLRDRCAGSMRTVALAFLASSLILFGSACGVEKVVGTTEGPGGGDGAAGSGGAGAGFGGGAGGGEGTGRAAPGAFREQPVGTGAREHRAAPVFPDEAAPATAAPA